MTGKAVPFAPDGRRNLEHAAGLAESRIAAHMVRGSAWMTLSRWMVRSIGLISTLVLARILSPADFGVIAMAMLVVAFIEVVAESGQGMALVRLRDPTPAHYDAAWTLQILLGVLLAAMITAAAPYAARFFSDERIAAVIHVLALRAFLNGFISTGIAQYRINLRYDRLFRYFVYSKLASFVIGVGLAVILQNYWALAVAMVGEKVVAVAASFRMHPYRPRLSLEKMGEIWGFSAWVLVQAMADYLARQIDAFWIGRLGTSEALGNYKVAEDMATAPTYALTMPMAFALFPIYAHLADARETLRRTALQGVASAALVAGLLGVGIASTAAEFVGVVLGPQWAMAAPLVVWHALTGIGTALTNNIATVLQVAGSARLAAALGWIRTGLLAVVLSAAALEFSDGDLETIAAARTATVILVTLSYLGVLGRTLGVPAGAVAGALWRPVLAAGVMALAIHQAAPLLTGWPPADLLAKAIVGTAAYAATLFAAWWLSGRPETVEREVARLLLRTLARR
ncbi:MAG TPA: lipopolysaccharide biosynthesis protein [Azospirillum sp.]|nr:lipopolysaccharide biosynthesis protein [Azospirillum sp.]